MAKERIHPGDFCAVQGKFLQAISDATVSEEQQREIDALYTGITNIFQEGKLVKGIVASIDNDGVLVDINYKSRGLISRYEFNPVELKKLKVGDEIEVLIETIEGADGLVVLSYEKAKALRVWNDITNLYNEGKPIEGVVVGKVKGGLNVDIGIPAFLPGSQIDLQRVLDFDQYVGQTITANILKVNKRRGNVIISRRKYLHDLRSEERGKVLDTLHEGDVIRGTVKNITSYGAFIDIGGIDGLLHITDMTWGRITHPSEMLKLGQEITVKVLNFEKATEKISLGMKQLEKNPWDEVEKTLSIGKRVKGKITSVTDYGIFVEVAPHAEGLVHISEISWTDRISNLASRYKVGQEIEVLVVSLDKENRRMSLSIKQLEKNPWDEVEERFKVGQHIKGKISNITDFGIFVSLLSGVDGLVHVSDLSWTEHIENPASLYKVGQEVEAVILGIDKANKKISLGIKQLEENPWNRINELYKVGDVVHGVISKITNFGAFIKLDSGVEGLIHNTTLMQEQGQKAEEFYKVDQEAEFRVINISQEEQKIGLSSLLSQSASDEARQGRRRTTTSVSPQKEVKYTQKQQSRVRMKGSMQMALESMTKDGEDEQE
jgi:small subunit ribosomal protein S1